MHLVKHVSSLQIRVPFLYTLKYTVPGKNDGIATHKWMTNEVFYVVANTKTDTTQNI